MSVGEEQVAANEKDDLVTVAHAVKVRGLRGEVVAELLTDFPERFAGVERLFAVDDRGKRTSLALEAYWFHQNRIVLKFKGYDSPEAAAALVGYDFAVTEAECVELEEDEFFEWQLIDCRVETTGGAKVGRVREILHTGSAPVLVVIDDEHEGREHLIPLAESICVEIDTAHKFIRVDAPEGLLEM